MKQLLILIFAMLITLAGFSQTTPTVPVTTQVTLDGSGSKDPDGSIVKYSWVQISGPAKPTIVTPSGATTVVKDYDTQGTYIYQLTVTDNQGATGMGQVTVTVLSANVPPVANAGSSITIQLPELK